MIQLVVEHMVGAAIISSSQGITSRVRDSKCKHYYAGDASVKKKLKCLSLRDCQVKIFGSQFRIIKFLLNKPKQFTIINIYQYMQIRPYGLQAGCTHITTVLDQPTLNCVLSVTSSSTYRGEAKKYPDQLCHRCLVSFSRSNSMQRSHLTSPISN